MRVKIILNPASDQGRAGKLQAVIEGIAASYGGAEIAVTERAGHARELARQAAADGYDLIAAAGGDGTAHEVMNGLMENGRQSAKMGLIPIGSGNDFAYALGIPTNITAAVERLFTGSPRAVDLGEAVDEHGNRAYFDNNFGFGLDAAVVIKKEEIVSARGFMLYFLAALDTILFHAKPVDTEIAFDEETIRMPIAMTAVGIGPRSGGGFFLTPDANHDDDLLDSCVVTATKRFDMLKLLLKSTKGTHTHSPLVAMRKNKRITFRSQEAMPIHLDGEIFADPKKDNVRKITLTSVPNALEVIV